MTDADIEGLRDQIAEAMIAISDLFPGDCYFTLVVRPQDDTEGPWDVVVSNDSDTAAIVAILTRRDTIVKITVPVH